MAEPTVLSFAGHTAPELALGFTMLPFTVPADIGRIEISYQCVSDLSFGLQPGENPHDFVADIAIFDPRGADFMGKGTSEGFRGSSGNSRPTIFITPNEATPGYMPGEIFAGEWQLMLGFYKVAPTGCDYQVTITLTPGDPHPATELPAKLHQRLPLRTESTRSANATGWYKGELHCHTFHSDGDSSPEEVVRAAERLGLDFLSITDHNTFTQQIVMNQIETPLMLIPGCEVTTFRGHWNIWGDHGWIDFRVTNEAQMEATIRSAVAQGYLTSCNHPRPEGPPWRFPEVEGYQCVEVWNGPWEYLNDTCLAFWEARINAGERLIAVGGSDCHKIFDREEQWLGQPTNVIYCPGDPSPAGIIDGLRKGHAFITRNPNGPQLYLSSGSAIMGDTVTAPATDKLSITVHTIGGSGMQLQIWTAHGAIEQHMLSGDDHSFNFEIDVRGARYIRAQLKDVGSGYVTALTNPIFIGLLESER